VHSQHAYAASYPSGTASTPASASPPSIPRGSSFCPPPLGGSRAQRTSRSPPARKSQAATTAPLYTTLPYHKPAKLPRVPPNTAKQSCIHARHTHQAKYPHPPARASRPSKRTRPPPIPKHPKTPIPPPPPPTKSTPHNPQVQPHQPQLHALPYTPHYHSPQKPSKHLHLQEPPQAHTHTHPPTHQ